MSEKNNEVAKTNLTLKVVLAIIGAAGIVFGILILVNVFEFEWKFLGTNTMSIISLVSSLVGITALFIAFNREIDSLFDKAENKKMNVGDSQISAANIIWGIVGIILLIFTIMLLKGDYTVTANIFGRYTGLILKIGLVIVTIASFLFAFWDFIEPSLKETKKITWPNNEQMKDFSVRVFSFIIALSLYFFLVDVIINLIKDGFKSLI